MGLAMMVSGKQVFHLVAKIERPDVRLTAPWIGRWLWKRLREAFPDALASCLMPDHPHVVAPLDDPEWGRCRVNRMLGQLARRLGLKSLGAAAMPKLIVDRGKLVRELRYTALNPPRAGLARDPLAWMFSTHRDVVGAVVNPWVTADRLASALRRPRRGFIEGYHRYVSADPSVDVRGTPLPRAARPTDVAMVPLGTIAAAVAAATRAPVDAIRCQGRSRNLFVGLALEQGWCSSARLARACGCTPRAIRRIAQALDPDRLAPVRLCLGDARLLAPVLHAADASAKQQDRRGERFTPPIRPVF